MCGEGISPNDELARNGVTPMHLLHIQGGVFVTAVSTPGCMRAWLLAWSQR